MRLRERETTIDLLGDLPSFPDASEFIWCSPDEYLDGRMRWQGAMAVQMAPQATKYGSIELPEVASEHIPPDIGCVISSGTAAYNPGDIVLIRPYKGLHFKSFDSGGEISGESLEDYRLGREYAAVHSDRKPKGEIIRNYRAPQTGTVIAKGSDFPHDEGMRIVFSRRHVYANLQGLDPGRLNLDRLDGFPLVHKKQVYAAIVPGFRGNGVRFLGGSQPIKDSVIAVYRDGWKAADGWVKFKKIERQTDILTVRKQFLSEGTLYNGTRIVYDAPQNLIITEGFGGKGWSYIPEKCVLMEIDG